MAVIGKATILLALLAAGESGAVVAAVGLGDGIGLDDMVAFAAGATTVITFFALLLRPLLRELRDFLTDWREFRRGWFGEPAAPGRDAVPGMMERMNSIDGEFKRNHGSTLKDAAFEARRGVEELQARTARMETRQQETSATVTGIETKMEEATEDRARILAIGEHNVEALIAAFAKAGLEPPKMRPIQ